MWNCNGMMIKGNNHSILRNTVFDTSPLNFESDGQDDIACPWKDFGTCECDDSFCLNDHQTCCVAGDSNTFENANSVFLGNGMDGFLSMTGGSEAIPGTSAVDAAFAVLRSENNSAGALFEQLRDPHNLDFRPRPGSIWAQKGIGAYGPGSRRALLDRRQAEWRPSTPVPPDGAVRV